jgi:hypothetical protein
MSPLAVNLMFIIAALAILSCVEHRKCTCWKRRGGTFLKPKWKRVDTKRDHDNYDDGSAA